MKVLLFLLAFVSVSFGYPIARTWTYHELSKAVEKENQFEPSPDKAPLMQAFDVMITSIFRNQDYINAILLSPTGGKEWTKTQLEQAINYSNVNQYHVFYIEQAYVVLNDYNNKPTNKGKEKDTTEVWVLALDISTWANKDITKALQDPSIKPDLLPYLRDAQKELDKKKKDRVTIITPVGLVPLPEGVTPVIIKSNSIVNENKNKN